MRVELTAGVATTKPFFAGGSLARQEGPADSFSPSGPTNGVMKSDLKMLEAGLPLRPELPGSREFKECLKQHGLEKEWPGIKSAYYFMKAAHLKQKRDDGTPYFHHCTRVAMNAIKHFGVRDPEAIKGALFHDIVEDTPTSLKDVRSQFGERTAKFVELMTKPELRPGQTYDQRNEEYLGRIEASGLTDAVAIKLADRYDNVEDTHLMPNRDKIRNYLSDTESHYLPMASRYFPEAARHMTAQVGKIRRWMAAG